MINPNFNPYDLLHDNQVELLRLKAECKELKGHIKELQSNELQLVKAINDQGDAINTLKQWIYDNYPGRENTSTRPL